MKSASRPHATIHDVALYAGASIKAVSRVMNDEPEVRPAMRERVRAVMAALQYPPNPEAWRMSKPRSYVIGLFYRVRMGGCIDRLQIGASRCCRRSRYMLAIEPLEWDEPALAAAGIDAGAGRIVDGGGTIEGGRRAAAALLDSANPPTAIVTAGDVMAFGAMFEAARRGVALPGGLSITGFDDVAQAAGLEPALMTVRQPVEQMGEAAAALVIAACGRQADGAPVRRMLEMTPVIRDSCAPPRRGDGR